MLAALAWLVAPACAESPEPAPPEPREAPADSVELIGTVEYVQVEGGCWGIRNDAGGRIEPLNLPPDFQQDGLRVRAAIRYVEGMGSICQIGALAEVERIEPLGD